jgi:sugar phosphate isomerase/epimerase
MNALALESLTAFALPPVDLVHLAADLGCRHIAIGLAPFSANPEGYAAWSLRDPATRRETKAALRDREVSISLGQGFAIAPGRNVADLAADLDSLRELGATRLCSVSLEPDLNRTLDQTAALAEMAGAVDAQVVLEFVPGCVLGDLSAALAALHHIGRDNLRLLIDTMHLVRSGGGAADVAALDPTLIGYAQICDAPLIPHIANYMIEAVTERLVPGTGELPLVEIVAALPDDVIIGVEVPLLARARAGEGPRDRAHDCIAGARGILAAANAR